MECIHTFGIDRRKRQADIALLFEYKCAIALLLFAKYGHLNSLQFNIKDVYFQIK